MPVKAIAPKIDASAADFLTAHFETLNSGAIYVIEAWPGLYQRTMHDLRGKFARGELMLMLDVMNGTWLNPGLAGQHLGLNVRDGIELDGLDQKWKIDGPALNAKLADLPIFALACLEIWAKRFWEQKEQENIEEWLEKLL